MDSLLQDLRHSIRMFRKMPSFTIAAVAALALGIATNTAMFSVVNTILLKSFAYRDSDRIVMFQNVTPAGSFGSASPTEFNWWRQQSQAFQDVSAYDFGVVNWTGEFFPEQIPTMHVSADFFRLCGTNALLGRTFTAEDDRPNAPKTVVLAYSFWQRDFDADPEIVGKQITLSGERHEIIGVVGSDLQKGQIAERSTLSGDIEIHEPPYVYLPLQIDPNSASHGHYFNVAGRVKPAFTLAAANAQLQASYRGYSNRWPEDDFPGRRFAIQPLHAAIVGGVQNSLLILWGAVGFVLLIACANVANLLLARATDRQQEIAIRAAMGAGRARILRQLLTESLMLSLAGGVFGLAGGYAGMRGILSVIPDSIPRIGTAGANVTLDWRVLGFTMGLSVVTGVLIGLIPALQSSRADLNSKLSESSTRSGTGLKQSWTKATLVTCEVGLAVVLMIGAGLLIRTFIAIRQVDPGFNAQHVLTMRMSLAGPQFENSSRVTQVIDEGMRRVRALPGVEAAATTCCVPLEDRFYGRFEIVGRPTGPTSGGVTGTNWVSPGYFEVFKIPIVQGRTFTDRDRSGPPVVIVNQTLARRFWADGDPLQDQIIMGGQPRQIVGVAGDVHDAFLNREPRANVYLPFATGDDMLQGTWAWVIRTRVEPISLSSPIQKELRETSGGLPLARVRTLEEILSRSMATENFNTVVLTIFACSALLLAAIGIYGLMTYWVGRRTKELGIRVALGAESSQIRKMVMFQGLRLAVAGAVCGIAAAFGLTRLIANVLFGVKALDPLVFFVVPITLVGVALLAVWFPAVRASRVDPIQALRHD